MSLTTAMFTGQSGMITHTRFIDVIGNNISNVNTVGFKGSRAFSTSQFVETLNFGTGPDANAGGVNPLQVGLGTNLNSVQRNLNRGTIQPTGINTDIAIEGNGYFVIGPEGNQRFTRAGNFQLDAEQRLVKDCFAVQGNGIDTEFNLVEGVQADIRIPLGTLTAAEATQNANFDGNLNASGDLPTTGAVFETRPFYINTGAGADPLRAWDPLSGTPGTAHDLSVDGNNVFFPDATLDPTTNSIGIRGGTDTLVTVTGIELGGKSLGELTFVFTSDSVQDISDTYGITPNGVGSTMDDFIDFMQDAMGITQQTYTIDGETYDLGGGVQFGDGTLGDLGSIVIQGNEGRIQNLVMGSSSFQFEELNPAGSTWPDVPPTNPLIPSRQPGGTADGESTRTTFVIYDSLGTPLSVDITFVLQDKLAEPDGAGTRWMWIAQSLDNTPLEDITLADGRDYEFVGANRVVGSGLVTFDGFGNIVENQSTASEIELARRNGANSPLRVELDFFNDGDSITALTDTRADLAMTGQDGSPIGTLEDFSVSQVGVIDGAFSNGLVRPIGQLTLATFTNPGGLIESGNNAFRTGPNSGEPIIITPTAFGVGRLVSGALETSNVDLSNEFVELINASTGFSANSRIITTSEQLLQELLQIAR